MVSNPDEVAEFISRIKNCFDQHLPVFVVLREVTRIDYDGITVLLSAVVRFKAMQIRFNGDYPEDPLVRAILESSGFFEHLYKSKFVQRNSYKLTSGGTIYTHAKRTVDSLLGEKIIQHASKTAFGEVRRCPGVQRTFIELMQNTNNHASMTQEGEKHWWLSVKHITEERRVAFSFVDYGVGVFYNLRHKPQENIFYQIFERLSEIFAFRDDAEILKLILNGDLHKTASGKPFRGKGLPGIYEKLTKNAISNLAIVTNDVYFNSKTDEYRMLKNSFEGTFVYWELTSENTSLPHGT